MLLEQTSHWVSWSLGLLDQLFRLMNWVLGSSRPKFFSKGRGDLESCYQQRHGLLEDLANADKNGIPKKYRLEAKDITWTTQSQDAVAKTTNGQFLSPLAEFLPKESKMAQFLLVEPSTPKNSATVEKDDRVFVIMLPATGEMGKGTRLSLARTLAKEYGWSSVILTAAYYGKRKPSGQTLFFLETVRDLFFQAPAIFQEGAMLVSYFQNEHGKTNPQQESLNNKVCVTGFSFGAAMAANACAVATRTGADGKRLACAAYVGCASPIVLAEGILETSLDWDALRRSNDDKTREEESLSTTQQWLHTEFNEMQFTILTKNQSRNENPIAVVRGMSMKHDGFIPQRHAIDFQKQLLTATAPSSPPVWEWLWGGHVLAALCRSVFHKQLVVDAVMELQNKQRTTRPNVWNEF